MRRLTIPVLFLHGTSDAFIPHQMSLKLYEETTAEKVLVLIPGGGHIDSAKVGESKYLSEDESNPVSWIPVYQGSLDFASFRKPQDTGPV